MKNSPTHSDAEDRVGSLLQLASEAENVDFSPELHARIMQAVSRQRPSVRPTTGALPGDVASRGVDWGRLSSCAAALAAVTLIASFAPWRPMSVGPQPNSNTHAPSSADLAAVPEPAGGPSSDSIVAAIDELSVAAAVAGTRVVQTVADQTVVDLHWELWDQHARVIGDALLDPLPVSWQPTDSEGATPTSENS